ASPRAPPRARRRSGDERNRGRCSSSGSSMGCSRGSISFGGHARSTPRRWPVFAYRRWPRWRGSSRGCWRRGTRCATISTRWRCANVWAKPESPMRFDEIYRQASGVLPLAEVAERLAAATPADKADVDLAQYRGITPPWNDWRHLAARGRYWARRIAPVVLEGEDDR